MAFETSLGRAFDRVVATHGGRCALHYPATDERVSYAELGTLVDRAQGLLAAHGLRAGQVLAMFHDKSPLAYAFQLAALRLGVIYTNLDPDSPWPRLEKIVAQCQPALVAYGGVLPHAAELLAAGVPGSLDWTASTEVPPASGEGAIHPGMPAYLMFTSGSTGRPKGAVMSHGNVLGFIAWVQDRFGVGPGDVLSNANPMYFDNSVFDFYGALFSGATLVPLTAAQVREPRQLVRLVSEAGCTVWFSVPSLLVYLLTTRALGPADFGSLRTIAFGGEGFPKARLRELYELYGARVRFENVYGPTECTCICSAYTIGESDFEDMQGLAPLGWLAPNFGHEVLALDDAEPGLGELFLTGPQVGLGYYNDPMRSEAAFVQNPRHSRYAERGYRTGDIVQRDAAGRLHFKGRVDHQIKHMGYRIELEEIEAALGSLAGVQECAVVYLRAAQGPGQIHGFAVTAGRHDAGGALAEELARLLPAYMLPRRLQLMDRLPKNANGKIDRLALTELATSTPTRTSP